MLEKQVENQVRFEWMLQNGQVEDHVLAGALAREYYLPLLQMVLALSDESEAARPLVLQTIQEAVEQRHRYTGEVHLKTWLFSLAFRRLRRAAGIRLSYIPKPQLALFLRYAQDLPVKEIGRVVGIREKKAAHWLEAGRRVMLATWGEPPPGRPGLPLGHGRNAGLLQESLDGLLDPGPAAQLDAHLETCPECRAYADGLAEGEARFRQAAQSAWTQRPLDQEEFGGIQHDLAGQGNGKSLGRNFSLSLKEITLGFLAIGVVVALAWSGGLFKPESGKPTRPARNRERVVIRITATPPRRTPLATNPEPPTNASQEPGVVFAENGTPLEALIPFEEHSAAGLGYSSDGTWSSTGPVSLATVLQYWGSKVNPAFAVEWLRPDPRDENVMPYELVDFAEERSRMKVLYRMGGSLELIRQLTRAGFPVIVQRGALLPENGGWIGRYQVVLGYEYEKSMLAVQVNFPEEGPGLVREETFKREWRVLNYAFLLVYPPEKEDQALELLGELASEADSARIAAQLASEEIFTTRDQNHFFAWFNRGVSLSELDDYGGAAKAFDEAFSVYESLSENQRPWRILWYQTRPYWAYYYTARYQDLIDLAARTLEAMPDPVLEESYYWRALGREALGDRQGAIADLEAAVKVNPHFTVGLEQLRRLTEES